MTGSITVPETDLVVEPDTLPPTTLAALKWQRRVLLMFASSGDCCSALAFDRQLDRRSGELKDRDMVVVRVPPAARAIQPGETANVALRSRFAVSINRFAVILVGKDGEEKFRTSHPPTLDDILKLIDAMPMRRAELVQRGQLCAS